MPSSSRNARCTRTMSATVMTGKSDPYGRPVSGLVDIGPVVPRHPPSRFVLTTKYWLVSKALPGPIMPSHQPRPRPAGAVPLLRPEPVPSAFADRHPGIAGGVRIAAERMADENDVVARRRERAIGLVGDADRRQHPTAIERHRRGEIEELRVDRADRARGGVRPWRGHAEIISPASGVQDGDVRSRQSPRRCRVSGGNSDLSAESGCAAGRGRLPDADV